MKNSKVAALVAGALVVGLTVGTLGIANAAVRHQGRSTHAAMQTKVYTAAMHAVSPVATLSKLTGLSVTDIMKLRASGESFAQIATDNGIDPATLVAQIVAARQAKLDALVAAGKLTAEQEQAILAKITAAVTTMVDHAPHMGSTTATGTMTPTGPMGPGAGTTATGTMTPGSGPMGPGAGSDASHTVIPGSGPATTTPGTGAGAGTGSTTTPHMTPGSGMGPGSAAANAGSGMM